MGFFKKTMFKMAKEMDKQRFKEIDKRNKADEHENKRQYYYNVAIEKYNTFSEITDDTYYLNLSEKVYEDMPAAEELEIINLILEDITITKKKLDITSPPYDLPIQAKKAFNDGYNLLVQSYEILIHAFQIRKATLEGILLLLDNPDDTELFQEIKTKLNELPDFIGLLNDAHEYKMAYLKHYQECMSILDNW